MLTAYVGELKKMLVSKNKFCPYPIGEQRTRWEAITPSMRESYIRLGESFLDYDWPPLSAELFRQYALTGNRTNYEDASFRRRLAICMLTVSECLEDKGRFVPNLINGIWAICEESTWIIPAHNHMHPDRLERATTPEAPGPGKAANEALDDSLPDKDKPVVDLFAAETAALLAWVSYLLGGKLDDASEAINRRIRREVNERVLEPYMESDRHWWMGVVRYPGYPINNWNPWCNANVLASLLLLEDDPNKRAAVTGRVLQSLDCFIAGYGDDGGCDEGPGYWHRAAGSLFDSLELLLDATDQQLYVYDQARIQAMGAYMYKMHVAGNVYVNFADSPAQINIGAARVCQYGRRTGDKTLARLGMKALQSNGENALAACRTLQHHMQHLFIDRSLPEPEYTIEPQGSGQRDEYDDWFPDIEVMCAREQQRAANGGGQGFVLAAKGGHNDESHNHNDVGHYTIYYNGSPLLIDVGPETYSARTFSDDRYRIWTMQSGYHNLPEVNGCPQAAGSIYKAKHVSYMSGDDKAELSLELSCAYPEQAGLLSWLRTCRLKRGAVACVEIEERFILQDESSNIRLYAMTSARPLVRAHDVVLQTKEGALVKLTFNRDKLSVNFETIPIDDSKLAASWGKAVYRLIFRLRGSVKNGSCLFRFESNIDQEVIEQ